MYLLSIEKITKEYDGVVALDRLSLKVEQGSIKGLIGPNGAGKSTLFHLISGVEKPDSGKIYFKGKRDGHLHGVPRNIGPGIGENLFRRFRFWET